MAMKMSNEDVHERIRKARAVIAAGVRLDQPDLEQRGREEYAEAIVENAIRLYRDALSPEARDILARLLFSVDPEDLNEQHTDSEGLAIEADARTLRNAKTPADLVRSSELPPETLYDPDDEFEEEEDDYEDWEDLPDDTEGDEV